jgi:elongation factor 1-gamma
MAAQGTLYGPPDSFRTQKVLVAAKYGNVNVKLQVQVPEEGLDLKKFPFGKYPAYETTDGSHKFHDAHAIAAFVGQSLMGSNAEEKAEIVQWLDLADNEFLPHVLAWTLPALSAMQYNKSQVETSKTELLRLLGILNEYLLTRTYLVGERITLADVALALDLLPAYQHVLEPELRRPFINVSRWLTTLLNQPQFKAVLGDVNNQLCTKSAQFDAHKFKEFQDASSSSSSSHPQKETGAPAATGHKEEHHGKKDKKGKKDHAETGDAAAAPPKKEEKKEKGKKDKAEQNGPAAAAGDAAEELDPTEEALAAEPEQKDPFSALPKGTWNMDEFKRVYSNEDTATKAIPYFWQNFDKEHYSIWHCEYKYPEELTLVFMSCNLISGMFQRLDKMRKNAFGSMCVFGTDNKSSISGLWFWRGPDLAFQLSPDWQVDYESYEWKKLDPNSEEAKKMVNEYFLWEGDFGGKKFNQGKIFK